MPQIDTIEFEAGSKVDIGIAAFRGCDNIEKIVFDGDGTSKAEIHNVSDNSFAACKNLSTPMSYHAVGIDQENNMYSNEQDPIDTVTINPIPSGTFTGCTSLPSVNVLFDDSNSANRTQTYQIGESEFSGCDVLNSVNLASGLTKLNPGAFSECKTLKGELVLPDTVIEISNSAFANCTSLTSIKFPKAITTIGDNAFYGCTNLTGALYIANTITAIGAQAFFGTNYEFNHDYYTSLDANHIHQ
jgi:hypothetical protein